jgi:cytochrome b
MNKILVWDIPARLFHWAFAASLSAAVGIGFLVDDDSALFQFHSLFGVVALFLLAVRLVTGFVGSRYVRFSSFPVRPREVVGYLISAVASKTKVYPGNNPGSATAAVLMFLLVPALFLSGSGYGGEAIEELHELCAWALLSVIAMHLAGLAWHTFRHGEAIALAMVTGKKAGKPEDAISSAHPWWGAVFLIGAGLWIGALFANHNPKAATVGLPGVGVTLQLGESESRGGKQGRDCDD